MGYRSTLDCVRDLEKHGHLLTIEQEIDPHLEMAEIQRRVYAAGGPALFFTNVKGCRFPMAGNLFGTLDRARFIFRDTIRAVERMVALKVDPMALISRPWEYPLAGLTGITTLPKRVRSGPVMRNQTTISQLPQLVSWPKDGGGFVTLPQVYSEDPRKPGWMKSNLGMYRIQLTGNEFIPDKEIGLHYQIHRGIGVQHTAALEKGVPFKVNIFVGGPPAMALASVMPLPEGLPELLFAGALAGHRIPLIRKPGMPAIHADADFCICGTIDPERKKPEGPFGDHLGYYSLAHEYPLMHVEAVYHRDNAVWPFTVVGRPPQEDTVFGELIHELTGPVIPTVLPGVKGVHAVDASGVHPLLLAIGSERYTPYDKLQRPQELLTQANAILGQGQLSLAKYLFIIAEHDDPDLKVDDIPAFLSHWLARIDWRRDLHFQTQTTIDTLDYTGHGINQGSKLVAAAVGEPIRELPMELPGELSFPDGFVNSCVCQPGILAIEGPAHSPEGNGYDPAVERFAQALDRTHPVNKFPLILIVDDSEFTARTLNNMLWVVFTRSNPAADVHGIDAAVEHKHWGCHGSLVIDARIKAHMAPPLEEDPDITRRVDELAAPGGPLHGVI